MDEKDRQWRLLFLYQIYRLVTVGIFYILYFYSNQAQASAHVYFSLWGLYFIFGLFFIAFWWRGQPDFHQQIYMIGTVDVLCMSFMLTLVGTIQSGFGVLMMVSIAVLSILSSGRLAIFFAALASCILLGNSLLTYLVSSTNSLHHIYQNGIYGAGFFAIALTSAYLAKRLRHMEQIAKERSRELASMQQINEYIVERLSSGVIYVDVHQQVKLINQAARHFFSWTSNKPPQQLNTLSYDLSEKLTLFMSKSQQHIHSGQTLLPKQELKVHFFLAAIADNPAVLILLEDMRTIAQQAQQLKLASLGRFSASIAHELRNPLGVIAHAAQLLGEEQKLGDADTRLKELILNNCTRMNGVIKNVLQLSRREQSRPELIDLYQFFTAVTESLVPRQDDKVHIDIASSNHVEVFFDRSQLEQILVIIIENAMVHGRQLSGEVSVRIRVVDLPDEIQICIENDGPAISVDKRQMIFEPFYTTGHAGTGMGLFIARDLCEINQASLTLAEGEGEVCFIIGIRKNKEIIV